MRQLGDTLVWLAMIVVIGAVIHFTPRLANYVSAMSTEPVSIERSHDGRTNTDFEYYLDDTFVAKH
jgi:hypothetical protein